MLAMVFSVALALRLWGIYFGLPFLYHPDEPAYVLQALAVGRGLPNGLTFANPPLYKYVLLAIYAITFGLGRTMGVYASQQQFIEQFRADPTLLYVVARIVSALFGALTVLGAYSVATIARSPRAGLIAAGLTAVTYLLVRESHFAVNDALVTLCVVVGLACCVRVARYGRRRDSILAGIVLGLAFSAKYQGVILLLPVVIAHRKRTDLLIALAAALATVLLTFPSLLTEPLRVVEDIYIHLYVPAHTGYDGLDPGGGYTFYVRTLALGLGLPMLVLACFAVAVGLLRRDRVVLIVGSVPLALFALLGSSEMYFARFILPAVPSIVILAALLVDELIDSVGRVIGGALVAVVLLGTAPNTLRFDALLTQADTRTEAREWIQTRLAPGSRVAVDATPLGPALDNTGADALVVNDFALFDHSLNDYRQLGVKYLVVSSFVSDVPVMDPVRDAHRREFSAEIVERGTVLAQFRPFSADVPPFTYDQIYGPFDSLSSFVRPGPTITIYELSR